MTTQESARKVGPFARKNLIQAPKKKFTGFAHIKKMTPEEIAIAREEISKERERAIEETNEEFDKIIQKEVALKQERIKKGQRFTDIYSIDGNIKRLPNEIRALTDEMINVVYEIYGYGVMSVTHNNEFERKLDAKLDSKMRILDGEVAVKRKMKLIHSTSKRRLLIIKRIRKILSARVVNGEPYFKAYMDQEYRDILGSLETQYDRQILRELKAAYSAATHAYKYAKKHLD
jgi:hypothetical protein